MGLLDPVVTGAPDAHTTLRKRIDWNLCTCPKGSAGITLASPGAPTAPVSSGSNRVAVLRAGRSGTFAACNPHFSIVQDAILIQVSPSSSASGQGDGF